MASSPLTGSFQILFLYDVCEEIRTEQLQSLIGGGRYGEGIERRRDPALLHPSPEYVRFERPPVVQQLGPLIFEGGERFTGELNYYDYGAVSLKLEQPFDLGWAELVALSSKWIADSKLEVEALRTVRQFLQKAQPALQNRSRGLSSCRRQQAANGGRPLHVHDGSVPLEPRLCAGSDGGHHSGDRTGVRLSRQMMRPPGGLWPAPASGSWRI